jgi:hypothetical protein
MKTFIVPYIGDQVTYSFSFREHVFDLGECLFAYDSRADVYAWLVVCERDDISQCYIARVASWTFDGE